MAQSKIEKLQAENAELKLENRRLKSLVSKSSHSKNHKKNPYKIVRKVAVVTLVIIATAMLAIGNIFFWIGNTAVKQDRFVESTQPIIKDPEVQQSVALYATNSIFSNIDVQKITEDALPPRADFLAQQLTGQLKTQTQNVLQSALAKPSFQDKWNTILANQHERFINFASQYEGDGTISLTDVYNQASAELKNTKLAFLADKQLPQKAGNVTIVNADWLPTFHKIINNIDTWRVLAVLILVLSLASATWLGRNKRKTLYIFSMIASVFMLTTLLALSATQEAIANSADEQYQEGVRNAVEIIFNPLQIQTITILLAVLLVGFITWISSNSRGAVAAKKQVALLFSGKLHSKLFGKKESGFLQWMSRNKRILQWGIVSAVAVIMLFTRLTIKALFLYALLMLVLVLAVEVVGGEQEAG